MAADPEQAGVPRTYDAPKTYADDRISVVWDASRCIHTAICLRRLPSVFDTSTRPWIDLTGAPAEEVAATVQACPTGALRYEPVGADLPPDSPDEPTTVEMRPRGPLLVRGRVRLTRPGGRAVSDGAPEEEYRVALCRCGASANKPFCDNSHRLIRFEAPPEA